MDYIREKIRLIQSLKIKKKPDGMEEIYELLDFLSETGQYRLDELQKEFIKNLQFFIPYLNSETNDDLDWPYMAKSIFYGTYPIEKIPNHLRDLTKKMYYNDLQ